MNQHPYTLILLRSSTRTFKAEKVIRGLNIDCRLIPVPRDISSDCGVCIRINQADRERVLAELEKQNQEIFRAVDV